MKALSLNSNEVDKIYNEIHLIQSELKEINKCLSYARYDVGLMATQKEVFKRFVLKSNELASINTCEDTKQKYLIKEKRTSRQESS